MRELTIKEAVDGIVSLRAHTLPDFMRGRPKTIQPITIILSTEDGKLVAVDIADAETKSDGQIDVLFEDGTLLTVEPEHRFRRFLRT